MQYRKSKVHSTLDFCSRLVRKETNKSLHKLRAYCPDSWYVYCAHSTAYTLACGENRLPVADISLNYILSRQLILIGYQRNTRKKSTGLLINMQTSILQFSQCKCEDTYLFQLCISFFFLFFQVCNQLCTNIVLISSLLCGSSFAQETGK